MNESKKYPRTLHAQFSLGTTSDDRFMPDGYVDVFAEYPSLVITEKLDGENTCMNKYGAFSRSHTSPTVHPWAQPLIERQKKIKNDLGDVELFGEGMFGIHSLEYSKLDSYFYLFAVRNKDMWLSWEEVCFYAEMFDFPTVPVLSTSSGLKKFIDLAINENSSLQHWITGNLGMTWERFVSTPGMLHGFDPKYGFSCSGNEGLVIRNTSEYKTNNGFLPIAENEMDCVMKLVRQTHVKTDVHWTKTWRKATLINYTKYNWHEYQYLENEK